jgi:hypothetical protein
MDGLKNLTMFPQNALTIVTDKAVWRPASVVGIRTEINKM